MSCNCSKKNNQIQHKAGCGCGPSCSCRECRETYHSNYGNGMGRYDEYPRPKSAMFDPRKIGQEWPEPNNDPLIPYVRANEQGLPYERLNQYKGMRNSLHGWSSMGGIREQNIAKKVTENLLFQLARSFNSYEELVNRTNKSKDMIHRPDNTAWPANNKPGYYKTREVSYEQAFFGFIPDIQSKKLLRIKTGGPEFKYFAFDGSDIELIDPERQVVGTIDSLIDQNKYPLICDANGFFGSGSSVSADGSRNRKEAGLFEFAEIILGMVINDSIYVLGSPYRRDDITLSEDDENPEYNEDDLKALLKIFLELCINATDIDDVAKGISEAVVQRLKKDFVEAREQAFYKYEIDSWFGSNDIVFIDPIAKQTFTNVNVSDKSFDKFKDNLIVAMKEVLSANYNVLSKIYKQLFDFTGYNQSKQKVTALETEIATLKTTQGNQVKELQSTLAKKNQEIEQLRSQLASANSSSQSQPPQQSLPEDDESGSTSGSSIPPTASPTQSNIQAANQSKQSGDTLVKLVFLGAGVSALIGLIQYKKKINRDYRNSNP